MVADNVSSLAVSQLAGRLAGEVDQEDVGPVGRSFDDCERGVVGAAVALGSAPPCRLELCFRISLYAVSFAVLAPFLRSRDGLLACVFPLLLGSIFLSFSNVGVVFR